MDMTGAPGRGPIPAARSASVSRSYRRAREGKVFLKCRGSQQVRRDGRASPDGSEVRRILGGAWRREQRSGEPGARRDHDGFMRTVRSRRWREGRQHGVVDGTRGGRSPRGSEIGHSCQSYPIWVRRFCIDGSPPCSQAFFARGHSLFGAVCGGDSALGSAPARLFTDHQLDLIPAAGRPRCVLSDARPWTFARRLVRCRWEGRHLLMAVAPTTFSGRAFSVKEVTLIGEVVQECSGLSRMELARTVCELLRWRRPNGRLKARECREFVERLDADGGLVLPDKRRGRASGSVTGVPRTAAGEPGPPLVGSVRDVEPLAFDRAGARARPASAVPGVDGTLPLPRAHGPVRRPPALSGVCVAAGPRGGRLPAVLQPGAATGEV